MPATDNYCGLFVNYNKNGDVLSKKVHCENEKNVSFDRIIMNDNKYYVETEVAEDKYVYVFDNNLII